MIGPGGAAGTPASEDVVTEWLVPFPGSMPFQIAARNDSVFYLTKDVGLHVGRLDVATARFTEWPTPYTTTSPGDIQVRASDGSVFIAAATLGEIGQLDVDTSTLTRWALPIDTSAPEATQGPWSLALDAGTAVFFEADDASGSYIGRLDTATGNLLTWRFPGATASRVVVAPDGTVLFNAWNGSGPYQNRAAGSGDRRVHQLVARQPTTVSDGGRSGWEPLLRGGVVRLRRRGAVGSRDRPPHGVEDARSPQ